MVSTAGWMSNSPNYRRVSRIGSNTGRISIHGLLRVVNCSTPGRWPRLEQYTVTRLGLVFCGKEHGLR